MVEKVSLMDLMALQEEEQEDVAILVPGRSQEIIALAEERSKLTEEHAQTSAITTKKIRGITQELRRDIQDLEEWRNAPFHRFLNSINRLVNPENTTRGRAAKIEYKNFQRDALLADARQSAGLFKDRIATLDAKKAEAETSITLEEAEASRANTLAEQKRAYYSQGSRLPQDSFADFLANVPEEDRSYVMQERRHWLNKLKEVEIQSQQNTIAKFTIEELRGLLATEEGEYEHGIIQAELNERLIRAAILEKTEVEKKKEKSDAAEAEVRLSRARLALQEAEFAAPHNRDILLANKKLAQLNAEHSRLNNPEERKLTQKRMELVSLQIEDMTNKLALSEVEAITKHATLAQVITNIEHQEVSTDILKTKRTQAERDLDRDEAEYERTLVLHGLDVTERGVRISRGLQDLSISESIEARAGEAHDLSKEETRQRIDQSKALQPLIEAQYREQSVVRQENLRLARQADARAERDSQLGAERFRSDEEFRARQVGWNDAREDRAERALQEQIKAAKHARDISAARLKIEEERSKREGAISPHRISALKTQAKLDEENYKQKVAQGTFEEKRRPLDLTLAEQQVHNARMKVAITEAGLPYGTFRAETKSKVYAKEYFEEGTVELQAEKIEGFLLDETFSEPSREGRVDRIAEFVSGLGLEIDSAVRLGRQLQIELDEYDSWLLSKSAKETRDRTTTAQGDLELLNLGLSTLGDHELMDMYRYAQVHGEAYIPGTSSLVPRALLEPHVNRILETDKIKQEARIGIEDSELDLSIGLNALRRVYGAPPQGDTDLSGNLTQLVESDRVPFGQAPTLRSLNSRLRRINDQLSSGGRPIELIHADYVRLVEDINRHVERAQTLAVAQYSDRSKPAVLEFFDTGRISSQQGAQNVMSEVFASPHPVGNVIFDPAIGYMRALYTQRQQGDALDERESIADIRDYFTQHGDMTEAQRQDVLEFLGDNQIISEGISAVNSGIVGEATSRVVDTWMRENPSDSLAPIIMQGREDFTAVVKLFNDQLINHPDRLKTLNTITDAVIAEAEKISDELWAQHHPNSPMVAALNKYLYNNNGNVMTKRYVGAALRGIVREMLQPTIPPSEERGNVLSLINSLGG